LKSAGRKVATASCDEEKNWFFGAGGAGGRGSKTSTHRLAIMGLQIPKAFARGRERGGVQHGVQNSLLVIDSWGREMDRFQCVS